MKTPHSQLATKEVKQKFLEYETKCKSYDSRPNHLLTTRAFLPCWCTSPYIRTLLHTAAHNGNSIFPYINRHDIFLSNYGSNSCFPWYVKIFSYANAIKLPVILDIFITCTSIIYKQITSIDTNTNIL